MLFQLVLKQINALIMFQEVNPKTKEKYQKKKLKNFVKSLIQLAVQRLQINISKGMGIPTKTFSMIQIMYSVKQLVIVLIKQVKDYKWSTV